MKKLRRSTNQRVIGGVSSGIGAYLGVDTVVVRLVLLTLLIVTGFVPVGILYLAAVVLVPLEDAHDTTTDV
jgi:phage shock protein PspC (stress-responsive transcriptional regulator)